MNPEIAEFTNYWNAYFADELGEDLIRKDYKYHKFIERGNDDLFINFCYVHPEITDKYNHPHEPFNNDNAYIFWNYLRKVLYKERDTLNHLPDNTRIYCNHRYFGYEHINTFCLAHRINSKNNEHYLSIAKNTKHI